MPQSRSRHIGVWPYRQEFLQVAQRKVPAMGRYLRRFGLPCYHDARRKVIRRWQGHFHLPNAWVAQSAWITLALWHDVEDYRRTLQWFASPPATNLSETGIETFRFPPIEREFFPS